MSPAQLSPARRGSSPDSMKPDMASWGSRLLGVNSCSVKAFHDVRPLLKIRCHQNLLFKIQPGSGMTRQSSSSRMFLTRMAPHHDRLRRWIWCNLPSAARRKHQTDKPNQTLCVIGFDHSLLLPPARESSRPETNSSDRKSP